MFRLLQSCDDNEGADEAPPVLASAAAAEDSPFPLPQPAHRPAGRRLRGLFDASTVAALATSADSGAALDAIAPLSDPGTGAGSGAAGSGTSLFLPLAIVAAALAFS